MATTTSSMKQNQIINKAENNNDDNNNCAEKDKMKFKEENDYRGILPCQTQEGGLYPKCDISIWLRSCLQEFQTPVPADKITGIIPKWLTGSLLQNGPGKFSYGSDVFSHLFDGSALIQKYSIKEGGRVFYQCRFLRTRSFTKNSKADAIVCHEFGTLASSKKRIASLANLEELMSDNSMISVYPLGEKYYAFYESPFLTCLDPDTLETVGKIDLSKKLGILHHGSHPHYDKDGNMISIGMKVGLKGPEYLIIKTAAGTSKGNPLELEANGFKATGAIQQQKKSSTAMRSSDLKLGSEFENSQIIGRVGSRWILNPCYMHSFSITDNYFIIIEQPFSIDVRSMVTGVIKGNPLMDSLKWNESAPTLFHVISRKTGEKLKITYKSKAFFYLHTINAYEDSGHIVIDISCYKNPDMLYLMNIDELSKAQSRPDYATLFRGRPQRFVLPLLKSGVPKGVRNLVNLPYTSASAEIMSSGDIYVTPQQICDVGCETPTIFYEKYNGKKYRYFYAVSSDVDDPVSSGQLRKVDTLTGTVTSWTEPNGYCAEPMFVPNPNNSSEDDGLIISTMIRGKPEVNYGALLILDAKSFTEIGRAEFHFDTPVPKPLHGYFTENNISV